MTRKTHYEDCDILVVGGGMAGTGAAFEARYWGKKKTGSKRDRKRKLR